MDHVVLRNPAQLKSWYQEESESEQPEESVGLAGHGVDIGGDLKKAVLITSLVIKRTRIQARKLASNKTETSVFIGKKGRARRFAAQT